MIEISGLYKAFGGKPVLNGVDLVVHSGEAMVIIGASGCGKSVLLRHMIGLLHPEHGTIRVDGVEIGRLKKKELYRLRKRFGMLFQGSALFDSLTVAENVGLALRQHTKLSPAEIEARVEEKLAMVGMTGSGRLMPSELSGGMKKRVGLARALAMDPDYVLYDEPTTGLDPITADHINDLMVDLKKKLGLTSVVVTHDMVSASKVGDRIAMLYQGRIIFCGTPEEIKKSPDERIQRFIRGEAD